MIIEALPYEKLNKVTSLFFPLFTHTHLEDEVVFRYLPEAIKQSAKEFTSQECKGSEGEIKSFWISGSGRRIVFFGLGERSNWNLRKNHILLRRFVQYAKSEHIKEFACTLLPSEMSNVTEKENVRLAAQNAVLAHFTFTKYKETPKDGWPQVEKIYILCENTRVIETMASIREGIIVGEETNLCRSLANTPGGDMTPIVLAKAAVEATKKLGVTSTIFDEKKMKTLGMGAILGVAKGSVEKPRLIILEYKRGPKNQKPLVLVGKGVTFDTGGLNLKPDNYIYEMHMDMSGGAAVIHGVAAIARLKLPVNVVGIIPAVENMPSGSSYHPGDLLKSLSGKTIEILNTDAEGRVILADALTYGLKYKPGLMVDFATLTGAAHVALGSYMSAVFTREHDEKLQQALIKVGAASGDYVWPLPLWEEYLSDIKGTFGDLANSGTKDRYGGAQQGAKFLEQFAGEVPWAHIDIAPRMTTVESDHLSKGASGVGVRFIVELAKNYSQI